MPQAQKKILCLGFFDGVHLGHRAILRAGAELARNIGGAAFALTFDRHPISVITGENTLLIDSFEGRISLLGSFEGIAGVETIKFTKELADMDWRDFFENIILKSGDIAGVAAGFDYSFGAGGRGRAEQLAAACAGRGLACKIVPAVMAAGGKISSSRIRELIASGDMPGAAALLGRPFALSGIIEEGRHIARRLGFPTLNMRLGEGIIRPRFGVYLSGCSLGGEFLPAITNVGLRPTITDGRAAVETHVLSGLPDEGYGKAVKLHLLEFLRDERRFEGEGDLRAQVKSDILAAEEWFSGRKSRIE